MWDAFLLALTGGYGTIKTAGFARRRNSLEYLGYALAAFFFTVAQGSLLLESYLGAFNLTIYADQLTEWFNIIAISFVLSGLAVLIRESKPVFAQFPLIYAAVPLLLVLSYWLIKDTLAIKELLLAFYQSGALLVALLMHGVHSYRANQFSVLLGATALYLITFIFYWFVPGMKTNYIWVWELLLGLSVVVTIFGLEYPVDSLKKYAKIEA